MNRNSLLEMSGRVMHLAARFTLNKGDDAKMMQEIAADMMNFDSRKAIERVQSFGFTSSILPRDESDKKQGQQGGGVGGPGAPKLGPAAEGIMLFLGGQRNHPVVIGVDDRRHRPMGLKPGENSQYDDQGQMTLLRRTGLFLLSLDDNGDGSAPGAAMLKDAEGRATGKSEKKERMVSIRHVEKKKQDRTPAKTKDEKGFPLSPQRLAEEEAADTKKKEDYKHEGETVNTEMRCTKNRIEFRAGDKVVGYYDVQQDTWFFTAKVIHNKATEKVKDEAPRIEHN